VTRQTSHTSATISPLLLIERRGVSPPTKVGVWSGRPPLSFFEKSPKIVLYDVFSDCFRGLLAKFFTLSPFLREVRCFWAGRESQRKHPFLQQCAAELKTSVNRLRNSKHRVDISLSFSVPANFIITFLGITDRLIL